MSYSINILIEDEHETINLTVQDLVGQGPKITISATPPANPSIRDLWAQTK